MAYQSDYSWRSSDVDPYGGDAGHFNVNQPPPGFQPYQPPQQQQARPKMQYIRRPGSLQGSNDPNWNVTGQGTGSQGYGPDGQRWAARGNSGGGGSAWHQNGDGTWSPGGSQLGNGGGVGSDTFYFGGGQQQGGGVQGFAQGQVGNYVPPPPMNPYGGPQQQAGTGLGYDPNVVGGYDKSDFYGPGGIQQQMQSQKQPVPNFGIPGLEGLLAGILGGNSNLPQPQQPLPPAPQFDGGGGAQFGASPPPQFDFNPTFNFDGGFGQQQPLPQPQFNFTLPPQAPQQFMPMPFFGNDQAQQQFGFNQFNPYSAASPMAGRSGVGVAT